MIGTGTGLLGGYLVAFLMKQYLAPDYLRDVLILAIVIGVFAVSDFLETESGLLAVTVMGILLANLELVQLRQVWHFKEKLSVLLISSLFIVLAANVAMADIMALDWRSLVLLAIVILVLRPLSAQVSALGSTLSRKERLFLSWIAPRGIVAAAVSSLFAFRLQDLGYPEARVLVSLTFLVIVGTVVLQGSTAKMLARWLGVAEAEPNGFLIMGAHSLARLMGLSLQEEGFAVRLVDSNWENVQQARLQGLDVYYGDILAEFTEDDLDLSGLGRLFALTSNDEANALACLHLRDEFGSSKVYQLPPKSVDQTKKRGPTRQRLGRLFPNNHTSYDKLVAMVRHEATIKKTPLTEQFTYADYHALHNDSYIPLLAFKGREIRTATADTLFEPLPDWTLVSLAPNELFQVAVPPAAAESQ